MAAALPSLIPRLRALLASGFAADADGALSTLLPGLANPLAASAQPGWVLSPRILAVRPNLASNDELVCALIALLPEVRSVWVTIAAARGIEAGQMAGGALLVDLVSALQGAAAWVEAALPDGQLAASPHAALERDLLGVSVEQAAATPALMRVLAAAAVLSQHQNDALPALPHIDDRGVEVQQNWTPGRLLALPDAAEIPSHIASNYVLRGALDAAHTGSDKPDMSWVVAHPWPLLLAIVVYAQDVWKAEARGGLLLELAGGQNAFSPSEISVLVQGPEGDETRCGTLSDLLLKSLAYLDVHCFPRTPSSIELNAKLAPLVGLMLSRQVWRYQDGASGQNGQYLIHPLFADACFRLPGSTVFNRTGRLLWQAIRINAESLRNERRSAVSGTQRKGESL
ncbi:hypothetical protein I5S60_10910 [Pseudomonas fluorescens]|nr:hypothetical protein [Pseudomonas fluorescens]